MALDRVVGCALLAVAASAVHANTVIYVDAAVAGGDGTSWSTAYTCLQDALAWSDDPARDAAEIRVAGGTYRPDRDQAHPDGTGDRSATFALSGHAVIRGGYLGVAAGPGALPDDRDPVDHPSVLSGDLAGDDGPDFAGNGENCYHVVTVPTDAATPVLDGFVVTAGHADGPGLDDVGGGVYLAGGAPTLVDCTFAGNVATRAGGAVFIAAASTPTVYGAVFDGNRGGGRGGGVRNNGSDPIFANCVFLDNVAVEGGGLHNTGPCRPLVMNCVFEGNAADVRGGAMYNTSAANPDVVGCTLTGNTSGDVGGGIRNLTSHPTVIDCDFTGNHAARGGGMANRFSRPVVHACRFEDNTADRGGGIYNLGDSDATVTSCVFRGNVADGGPGGGMLNDASSAEVVGSLFVDNWADDGGAMGNDQAASPLVDGCTFIANTAAQRGGAVLCRNGAAPVLSDCSLTGNAAGVAGGGLASVPYSTPQIAGSVLCANTPDQIDGFWADGGGNEVSDACPGSCPPDVTGEGRVDTTDLLMIQAEWGPCAGSCVADVDGDGVVGVTDILAVLAAWGDCPDADRDRFRRP
jgi:predicted outer membrane repeat protein